MATISLNKSTLSLPLGGSATLVATVIGGNKGVTWTASNTHASVTTYGMQGPTGTVVANGFVQGVSLGTTVITATSIDSPGATATCTVSTGLAIFQNFASNPIGTSPISLLVGKTTNLSYYAGGGATNTVTWSATATTGVATITNLALTTNVVTITAANTFTAGEQVTLAGLTTTAGLNGSVLTVSATGLSTSSFQAPLTHANIGTSAETGTANPALATVSSTGVVSGLYPGNMTITATSVDNSAVTANCVVSVGSVSAISVSPTTSTVSAAGYSNNNFLKITPTVTVSGGLSNAVVWTSSNSQVATVDSSGLVIPLKAGTVTITATSVADKTKSASCTVTVKVALKVLNGLAIATKSGLQYQLSSKIFGALPSTSNTTSGRVTYQITGGTGTVGAGGAYVAGAIGTDTILVTSVYDPSVTATITSTVTSLI